MMLPALILYGTEHCHLCELAEGIVATFDCSYEVVDIAEDDLLLQRYGTSIPVVVRSDTHASLHWPFTAEELCCLLVG
jgi:hypothetical protein